MKLNQWISLATLAVTLITGQAFAGEMDESLKARPADRIILHTDAKTKKVRAFKVPKNVVYTREEMIGLSEDEVAERAKEIIEQVAVPENEIPASEIKLVQLNEKRGEMATESTTPACWGRRWWGGWWPRSVWWGGWGWGWGWGWNNWGFFGCW